MTPEDKIELNQIIQQIGPALQQAIQDGVLGALRQHHEEISKEIVQFATAELKIAEPQRHPCGCRIGIEGCFSDLHPKEGRPTADEYTSLAGEINGRKRADIFVRTHPDCGLNVDNMTGWFANAIMAGYDNKAKNEREKIERMQDLMNIQGADGNWNANEYMLGLFNGMENMMAIMEERDPQFRSLPEPTEAPLKTVQDVAASASRVKPQEIWAQVYSATYAANQHKGMPSYVADLAKVAADDAVQQFGEIIK